MLSTKNWSTTSGVTGISIPQSVKSAVQLLVDVGGELPRTGALGPHDRHLVVTVDPQDRRSVRHVVAAARQLLAVLDGDGEGVADVDDRLQGAGQSEEPRVE